MAFSFKYTVLAPTYFRPKGLSSALAGLIALFGMGRDVTPPSKHQNTIFEELLFINSVEDGRRDLSSAQGYLAWGL